MTGLVARRLRPADRELARKLFALLADVFGEERTPLGDAYLDRLLAREDFWAIAAFSGEEIVGGLTAHTLPLTTAEQAEVVIYDLAVRADVRRRGVGRALIEALRAGARAQGIERVFVAADDEDVHALEFYRALGGVASPVTMFVFEDTED